MLRLNCRTVWCFLESSPDRSIVNFIGYETNYQTPFSGGGSLKLCENTLLRDCGYRTIHLKRHNYFMIYRIIDNIVRVDGIYHDLQDYENYFK